MPDDSWNIFTWLLKVNVPTPIAWLLGSGRILKASGKDILELLSRADPFPLCGILDTRKDDHFCITWIQGSVLSGFCINDVNLRTSEVDWLSAYIFSVCIFCNWHGKTVPPAKSSLNVIWSVVKGPTSDAPRVKNTTNFCSLERAVPKHTWLGVFHHASVFPWVSLSFASFCPFALCVSVCLVPCLLFKCVCI